MAWEGKTLVEICAQIKDPARNGDRTPETLVEHIGEDIWSGGRGRPGSAASPRPERRRRRARSSRHG